MPQIQRESGFQVGRREEERSSDWCAGSRGRLSPSASEVSAAKAEAKEKDGTAEANVVEIKFQAEAKGITEKAEAMKIFDGVGREHEEFKLNLNKDKEIELAQISVTKDIAEQQALIVGEALKSAQI